jgi:murein DD-endopeptidase MepM/ murein hydrolase activator NlpD
MASAAQRRKKRIERKVKAQGSSRVTPAEVINLLSAASAIEPSSATTEKVSVAIEPNPATLKPAEAPTKSKHLEPLPQFSAVHVAVSKPHYGHAKPPAAVDRIQDQLAPEPLRRRSLKVGALRDRVAVACCLIRHQFSDWLGELSKPAFERAVDMIAQRSLQLAAAVQPISRPIQQQFERLPLHLFGLEMWARSRRKQLAAGSAASLLAVTAFATAPFSEEALPPPQMLAESLVAASTVFDFQETLVKVESIRRGESMASLLARMDLIDRDLIEFVKRDAMARKSFQLLPGRLAMAEVDGYGKIQRFVLRTGGIDESSVRSPKRVVIVRDGDAFDVREELVALDKGVETRAAEIQSSLFAATDQVGIPEAVASRIADIFGGDIDFHRDLRKGDRLRVMYETLREPGGLDTPTPGRVLGIEFFNAGRRLEAFWFDPDGDGAEGGSYYDAKGQSLKKAFLRNPVEFSRVSSGFSGARLHPIFQQWRAHRGVDFSAPHGTRVRAAGDGVVSFVGRNGGYGNMVVLRHRDKSETVYAHLSSFAEGLRVGQSIQQGESIGEVGATGWATGPHLHYEFRVKGEPVDPMTTAFQSGGIPVPSAHKERFASYTSQVKAQLNEAPATALARFE